MNINALKTYTPYSPKSRGYCCKAKSISTTYQEPTCLKKASSIKFTPANRYQPSKYVRNPPHIKHITIQETDYKSLMSTAKIDLLKEYKNAGINLSIVRIGNQTLIDNAINNYGSYHSYVEELEYTQELLSLIEKTPLDYSNINILDDHLFDILYFNDTKETISNKLRNLLKHQQKHINSKNDHGDTPLCRVLQSDFSKNNIHEIVTIFFEFGAEFNTDDINMKKAYQIFINSDQYDDYLKKLTMKLLQDHDKKSL